MSIASTCAEYSLDPRSAQPSMRVSSVHCFSFKACSPKPFACQMTSREAHETDKLHRRNEREPAQQRCVGAR
eukprot:3688159-Alexandrium_andersonii.AAC.1